MTGKISNCNFSEFYSEENESSDLSKTKDNCLNVLTSLRKDNVDRLIFAHLNINSIRNKFDNLSQLIRGKIDVLLISETKINDSFPKGQFLIDGFSGPYRLDRNYQGGGLMLFVREDIPYNLLTSEEKPIESFYVKLNLRNSKWLINCSYNPHRNNISAHLDRLSKSLDVFSSNYDKLLLLGDFHVGVDENHMKSFCENYDLKSLIKQPTCYKNPDCPTFIDLILTNVPRSFQSTCVVETGLSDFHLMTLTVLRKSFKKFQPKLIKYRSYKTFSNKAYRETLINNLSKEHFINNDDGFQRFCDISLNALNKHAPCKKKHARGNQMPFLNKDLSKAIMTRTKLRNIFFQNKSEENKIRYTKQRNFCVSLLRKTKKRYYENLNEKSVVDNKLCWKTIKPLLSDKVMGKDHIHLFENDELIKTDLETAEVFNNFFSSIVQNLKISRYTNEEPIVSNINDPTLKAILKYRNHPSITAIQNKCKIKDSFNFVEVDQQQKARCK